MDVVTLGVHVVDVLVRPVEQIPAGQGGTLVEQIRITPAGPAGGTAVTLAKLGASVRTAGAIGADELGDVLTELLGRFGVDTSLLVRREGVQTSASVLPIRRDGSRPAFHVIGANATYSSSDAPWEAIAAADYLHVGAPEFMGGVEAAKILSFARERGVVTSADILAPGDQAAPILDWIAPALAHLDYLLANEEQVLALGGSVEWSAAPDGGALAVRLEARRDLPAPPVQPAHDRPLPRPQGARRLAIRQPHDVDRDERLPQRQGQFLKSLIDRRTLDRQRDRIVRRLDGLDLLAGRSARHLPLGALGADPRVPQHPQQVHEILVTAQEARAPEHPLEGVLHEVLGILARPAQAVGRAVEPCDV